MGRDPWHCDKLSNIWFNSAGHTNQIEYDSTTRRVYLSAGDSELIILDVSNPASLQTIQTVGDVKDGLGAWGMHVTRGHGYVT